MILPDIIPASVSLGLTGIGNVRELGGYRASDGVARYQRTAEGSASLQFFDRICSTIYYSLIGSLGSRTTVFGLPEGQIISSYAL